MLRSRYATTVARQVAGAQLQLTPIDLPPIGELPEPLLAAAKQIVHEADEIRCHRVAYLGSGTVSLGGRIDWHRDFRAGHVWPTSFYLDVPVIRTDDGCDPKVPWELSRGHQLLTLARAARLARDEAYVQALHALLVSWLDANPPGRGINWTNPMEVALRAVNWLWALRTCEPVLPLSEPLRTRITEALVIHGRHIAANLEGGPLLRGNHYLADMVGLASIAAWVSAPESVSWHQQAQSALEREILRQVHRDGSNFEASLPYHGLALELFLVGMLALESKGRPVSDCYRRRLRAMIDVSRAVRHPSGRAPVLGDQDSSRVLPGGFARPATHDPIIWLAAAVLDLDRPLDTQPDAEVAWTLGIGPWQALSRRHVTNLPLRRAYPDGGIYVLQGQNAHLVTRWGGVGQNGVGGHAHNDVSSFEVSLGSLLVLDSGTYTYTADRGQRQRDRSARAHNVLVVDGRDMHPLPPDEFFRLPQHGHIHIERFERSADRMVLVGWHDGFRRGADRLKCRRTLHVHDHQPVVEVIDEVTGHGGLRLLESRLHLAPGVEVAVTPRGEVKASVGGERFVIAFDGADEVDLQPVWISSEYGKRESSYCVVARVVTRLPATLACEIRGASARHASAPLASVLTMRR